MPDAYQLHPFFSYLALMLIAHSICDYALQGDFMAKGKNHKNPIPQVPWQWPLASHSAIHGGAVWIITGYWFLGLIEFFAHGAIDYLKSNKTIDYSTDQISHIIWKVLFAAAAFHLDQLRTG